MSEILLEARNLKKTFGERAVLNGITLQIHRGEVVVIVGPSGCGKSTLLRCLNGLEKIDGGEILLNGARIDEKGDLTEVRRRVEAARAVQRARYAGEATGVRINAQLSARNLNAACPMKPDARELLLLSCERLRLSNRAYTRILKVARTIADLEGAQEIAAEHISEAVQYRTLDRKYWG